MVVGSSLRHSRSCAASWTPGSCGSPFRLRHLLHARRHGPLLRQQRIVEMSVSAGDEIDLGAWPVAEGSSPRKAGTTFILDYSSPPVKLGKIANWYVHPGLIDLGLLRG